MNTLRLIRMLLSIGARAGRSTENFLLRRAALAIAFGIFVTAIMAAAVTHATYEGRATRQTARSPIPHTPTSPGSAQALWRSSFDDVTGRQFSIVFIVPLNESVSPPPGLTHWLNPGEVALSPALRRDGASEGIDRRYGVTVAEIQSDGLVHPEERFAYIRPPDHLVRQAAMQPIDGFGTVGQPPFGAVLNANPEWVFQLLVGLLLFFPSIIFVFVAIRVGAHFRDRRIALASVLGGDRLHRATISLGEVGSPIAIGAALSFTAGVVAAIIDLEIPGVGYTVFAHDVRTSWMLVLSAWAIGVIVAVLAVLLTDSAVTTMTKKSRPIGNRGAPNRMVFVFPVAIFVAVQGAKFFEAGTPERMLVNYLGVIATLISLPAVVGIAVSKLGSLLAKISRSHSWGGTMVAGRWMAARANVIARVSAGIIAALGLLIQIQVWYSFLGEPVRLAQAAHARLGNSVMIVSVSDLSDQRAVRDFVSRLPPTAAPLRLSHGREKDGSLRIVGDCAALAEIGVDCTRLEDRTSIVPNDRLDALCVWFGGDPTRVDFMVSDSIVAPEGVNESSTLVLLGTNGRDLPPDSVKEIAFRTLPGGGIVLPLGGSWLVGASVNADYGRWIVFFGTISILVLALACGVIGVAEYFRLSRTVLPIAVLSGSGRFYLVIAAWGVLVPVALAGISGICVGLLLSRPMVAQGVSHVSTNLILAGGGAVLVLGAALWLVAVAAAFSSTRRWLPGSF